jgi:transcriptional regulator with XRE-family HTH domain
MTEIPIENLKKLIADNIRKKYDMSITEFSNSEHADKLGIKKSSLRAYLSKSGNVSFKALKKVAEYLEMANIKRVVTVTKTYKYYTNEKNK